LGLHAGKTKRTLCNQAWHKNNKSENNQINPIHEFIIK
jgi:hypothetical protein